MDNNQEGIGYFIVAVILFLVLVTSAEGSDLVETETEQGWSYTLSVVSLTHHGTANHPASKAAMDHSLGDGVNTAHPGLYITAKDGANMLTAWVFSDSFQNPAGGLLYGRYYEIWQDYITLGIAGGVYVRQNPQSIKLEVEGLSGAKVHPYPISLKAKGVEIAPMGGVTASVNIPLTKSVGLEVNCLANVLVNTCTPGLKFSY